MADDVNRLQITNSLYTKEADYLKSVDKLIEKLELALDNDMEIRPYKLRELINEVKLRKTLMLNKD